MNVYTFNTSVRLRNTLVICALSYNNTSNQAITRTERSELSEGKSC
jgi:hypothetical protein